MTPGGGEPKRAAARGLAASLAQLGRTLAATLHSRAELLSLELARERSRLVRLIIFAMGALIFFVLTAFTLTLFIIVLFWDTHRVLATGALVLIYAGAGMWFVASARKEASQAGHPFSATLEQLRKDRDELVSRR